LPERTTALAEPAAEVARLGQTIRKLRRRQRRTLQEIAAVCGFTRSLLSKIETGRTTPPIATLMRIAAALGVPVSALLEADGAVSVVVETAAEVAQAPLVQTDVGYCFHSFAGRRPSKLMQPFLFVARRGELRTHTFSHVGEEFIYVLEGRMNYRVGDAVYLLGPGDAVYFDGELEHSLAAVTDEVRYLGVFVEPHAGLEPAEPA